jgi:hypothetical protein
MSEGGSLEVDQLSPLASIRLPVVVTGSAPDPLHPLGMAEVDEGGDDAGERDGADHDESEGDLVVEGREIPQGSPGARPPPATPDSSRASSPPA